MKSLDEENEIIDEEFQTVQELMLTPSPDFDDVMRCVFKIKNHEIEVYYFLLDHPNSTITEISEFLNKDRSSVQRSLQTLMDKGMIHREYRVLGTGGFTYIYTATPLDEIKKTMKHELKIWYSIMNRLVMDFDKQ